MFDKFKVFKLLNTDILLISAILFDERLRFSIFANIVKSPKFPILLLFIFTSFKVLTRLIPSKEFMFEFDIEKTNATFLNFLFRNLERFQ